MSDQQREFTVEWSGSKKDKAKTNVNAPSEVNEATQSLKSDLTEQNPEDLFLSSLSACHMVLYLNLCASNNIEVVDYEDKAKGVMIQSEAGKRKFKAVTLCPTITIKDAAKKALATNLHKEANAMSFIANSCDFETGLDPIIQVE